MGYSQTQAERTVIIPNGVVTAPDTATAAYKIATPTWVSSNYQSQPRSTGVTSGINLTLPTSLIDTTDFIHITQTVTSIVYTLANPTSTKSRAICIVNKTASTQSFTVSGVIVPVGQTIKFDWDGISWKQQVSLATGVILGYVWIPNTDLDTQNSRLIFSLNSVQLQFGSGMGSIVKWINDPSIAYYSIEPNWNIPIKTIE